MNPGSGQASASLGIQWIADLTFEHEGRVAARLRSDARECVLDLIGRQGLRAFRRGLLKALPAGPAAGGLAHLACLMPKQVSLRLSGVPIGRYEPAAPLNGWSRELGLPFGSLTIDTLVFARAYMLSRR